MYIYLLFIYLFINPEDVSLNPLHGFKPGALKTCRLLSCVWYKYTIHSSLLHIPSIHIYMKLYLFYACPSTLLGRQIVRLDREGEKERGGGGGGATQRERDGRGWLDHWPDLTAGLWVMTHGGVRMLYPPSLSLLKLSCPCHASWNALQHQS